jgi:hypothetical protein
MTQNEAQERRKTFETRMLETQKSLRPELEMLLKAFMRASPDKEDNLFEPSRPLGSFSSRIDLS